MNDPGPPPPPGARPRRSDVLEVLTGPEQLRVHLQPIVELTGRRVWGLEALARFPGHPQPGPSEWFALAGRAGWGTALETVALCGALDILDRLPAPQVLAVNLSAAALLRPEVTELLQDAGPDRLIAEITEHEQVADYAALLSVLAPLRSAGLRIGIDDFGAGHSSLRHVLQLAPDVVKLDISLTARIDSDPSRQALVESMLSFCARVGAIVIAEGVEEQGELATLLQLGVQYAQGWFLARPAPPDLVLGALP